MAGSKRKENEQKFKKWITTAMGGRVYRFIVPGKHGWVAHYVKEVDADELTLSFRQEIYDESGNLREIHVKYPEDKGHIKL
ncbi:hypothetical protein ACO2Q8_26765 [Larkinella sp. VNQ87]|uniref:hypothetical protein n=1 Tax=Larkinella sp. VNQ87 TaxID=3400921 RepID=UPI003C0C5B36